MFIATYKQFGIEITPLKEEGKLICCLGDCKESPDDKRLRAGYFEFFTAVYFTLEGNFIEQGFYE